MSTSVGDTWVAASPVLVTEGATMTSYWPWRRDMAQLPLAATVVMSANSSSGEGDDLLVDNLLPRWSGGGR
jgi:hypothetical protein